MEAVSNLNKFVFTTNKLHFDLKMFNGRREWLLKYC